MNYLELKVSRLSYQLDISKFRSNTRERLKKQYSAFLNKNGGIAQETIDIILLRKERKGSIDASTELLTRKNLEIQTNKFPFSNNPEKEIEDTIKKLSPFLNHKKVISLIKGVINPEDFVIFPVTRGCFIRTRRPFKSTLFLKIRWLKGISLSSIGDALNLTASMALPSLDCMLLHGVGIKNKNAACMFLGLSGSGKTTIAGFSPKEDIISDDGIIVEKDGSDYFLSPAPIDQSSVNNLKPAGESVKNAPLSMIFFLKKDNEVYMEKLLPAEACSIILKNHIHYFKYFLSDNVRKTLSLISDMCRHVPVYRLHFTMDTSFLALIEDEMSRLSRIKETYNGFG